MEVSTAVDLINALIYKPGWRISATDHTHRFEGSIVIRIDYPAHQLNRNDAKEGYPVELVADASFKIIVGDCDEAVTLYRRIIQHIITIETHEAREALRVQPTYWAPFHPHKIDGMERWGDVAGDLHFGEA